MSLKTKSPNTVDVHVGARIAMRRRIIGMSQEKLGDTVGITFQQIQKYEKGANRVSASRLVQIANALEVPPAFFFEGLPGASVSSDSSFGAVVTAFLATEGGLELARMFTQVDPRVRTKIFNLVKSIAEAGSGNVAA